MGGGGEGWEVGGEGWEVRVKGGGNKGHLDNTLLWEVHIATLLIPLKCVWIREVPLYML